MLLLIAIGVLAGAVTAVSPCVLPVIPLVLADAALGSRRRVLVVVGGLVVAFTALTLGAALLLDALGLPADALRIAAVVVVVAAGVSLALPRLGDALGRPFRRVGRRPGEVGGGLLYGASLALLFTPCAGPVIAAVATVAASRLFSVDAVAVTAAFGLGAGAVLLALALAGRRLAPLRARAPRLRRILGLVVAATGVLIALGVDRPLATHVPDYTAQLRRLEHSAAASASLSHLTGRHAPAVPADALDDYGPAPEFRASGWLNTTPLTLRRLRGRVVLVDFWTYSCLNCLRTLPTLRSWQRRYRTAGLVVVGVHTPEFAFERDADNVRAAARSLDVGWPVALDRDYATWNAWRNDFWPSEYLVDRRGRVRYFHRGEGSYAATELAIRGLLAERRPPPTTGERLLLPHAGVPGSVVVPARTPLTPETYLGLRRRPERVRVAAAPPPADGVSLGGGWRGEPERVVAGPDARLLVRFRASQVWVVLAGRGRVDATLDGRPLPSLAVTADRAYRVVALRGVPRAHLLELRPSLGLAAYAFTFG